MTPSPWSQAVTDSAMALPSFQLLAQTFASLFYAALERHLRECITSIEGREPTSEEIAAHCRAGCFPDGSMVYSWRGADVLKVHPFASISARSFSRRVERLAKDS